MIKIEFVGMLLQKGGNKIHTHLEGSEYSHCGIKYYPELANITDDYYIEASNRVVIEKDKLCKYCLAKIKDGMYYKEIEYDELMEVEPVTNCNQLNVEYKTKARTAR